jgi:hypothetical protein
MDVGVVPGRPGVRVGCSPVAARVSWAWTVSAAKVKTRSGPETAVPSAWGKLQAASKTNPIARVARERARDVRMVLLLKRSKSMMTLLEVTIQSLRTRVKSRDL